MSHQIPKEVVAECKSRLMRLKADLLNRMKATREHFLDQNKSQGDEIDQSVAQIFEDHLLITQERNRQLLYEIESALSRIQNGNFGLCEETLEPIEVERLMAIPYTRLSVEGAEIRESSSRTSVRVAR